MSKRLAQIALLLITSLTMLGAGSPANRFDKVGHNLMCTCSCGEILLECNHVGCPTSGPMIEELRTQLASGSPDKQIFHFFELKYGAIALASPMRGGFDRVAWVMPFAVLALGIAAAIWLTRHWHDRHTRAAALANPGNLPPPSPSEVLRERIRRDTDYDQ